MRPLAGTGQLPLFSSPHTVAPATSVTHTPGHINCPACFEARTMFTCPISASMRFSEAATAFLAARTAPVVGGRLRYVGRRTLKDNHQYLKALGIFFGQMRLCDIHVGHFAEYQRARSLGEGYTRAYGKRVVVSTAGPAKINSELSVLERLMTMAGAWTPELEQYYMRLQVDESEMPRALSPDEQDRFMLIAASRPEWQLVWWYSLVAVHLTFSTDEMRTIRIGDINLSHQIVSVNRRYGKNKFRRREIPICDGACQWAIERLIERCGYISGVQPHHYLFPGRVVRNTFNPEKHMSETGMRKQFEAVRDAAGVPWFKLNGWRHTAITRLAEAGVPIATIMQRSGHVTPKMSEHYTHVSNQAQRIAIVGASQRKPVISIRAGELKRAVGGWG
jgi:integrase